MQYIYSELTNTAACSSCALTVLCLITVLVKMQIIALATTSSISISAVTVNFSNFLMT